MSIPRENFKNSKIPNASGVYIYRDRFGKVIYVGKARNLRRRMSQYFQQSRFKTADPKLRSLIKSIAYYEYQTVKNEDESLILESRLIKQYSPRYNVLMRDDKRFLMIKINLNEPYPKLQLARVHKDDGCRYFGPFPKGYILKDTVEFLSRYFRLRMCSAKIPDECDHRHCLAARIKDCSAPCLQKVSRNEYMQQVNELLRVLDGDIRELTDVLKGKMAQYATKNQFELAAKQRDMISNLEETFGAKNRNFRFAKIQAFTGMEAVDDLQKALGLPTKPLVIEGFDISNISGELAVASMVCCVNGKPAPRKYRRFRIKTVHQIDDFAMMNEVITRHFSRKLKEGRPLPDLLMVDGGKGQLSSAIEALKSIGCPPFPVIGLAKKREEVFKPNQSEPILIDHHRSALRLLQTLRDEAHRFAITYHRSLRNKRLQESLLDEIPGVGTKRKIALLKEFGSVRELRKATAIEIQERMSGVGEKLAEEIVAALKKGK
ncbi:excinuclease ABC subunit UvrC [Lentisphaerota bacterium WC36G]|nr:excinuclease ABC subunit UvrC [Lentisphaerae bacterium WC36]